jgi:hypothetical protein
MPEHCAVHVTLRAAPVNEEQHTSEPWHWAMLVQLTCDPPSGHESAHEATGAAKAPPASPWV